MPSALKQLYKLLKTILGEYDMKQFILIAIAILLSNSFFAIASSGKSHAQQNSQDAVKFSFLGNGYFFKTSIDINNDGTFATLMTFTGKSKELGAGSGTILTDIRVGFDSNGVPKSCVTPDGFAGIAVELVKSRGVFQLKNGDQLFTEATSLTSCLGINKCIDEQGKPKEGCEFESKAKANIVGGTGAFVCATGEIETGHTRTVLAVDTLADAFGSVSDVAFKGSVVIPASCDK